MYTEQEAMGKVAEAEHIYGKLKEENPTNPVRTAFVTVCARKHVQVRACMSASSIR